MISLCLWEGGDVVQLVECQTGSLLRLVQFRGAARDFSPIVRFQSRLFYRVRTALVCNLHA